MTWYRAKYPSLKHKDFPDSPGSGVVYATTDKNQYKKAGMMAAFDADGVLTGRNGLIAAPRSYKTGVQIYYQPHGHRRMSGVSIQSSRLRITQEGKEMKEICVACHIEPPPLHPRVGTPDHEPFAIQTWIQVHR